MAKYPSEIFGHPVDSKSEQAKSDQANHRCPFVDKPCYKQSRLIPYPFGVCPAHIANQEVALCPRRFLDRSIIFTDIAKIHFKTQDNLMIFPEVRLKDIGNFDFVMVKHKPMSPDIEDFVIIEFQTGQTSNTGGLVKGMVDFMAGESVQDKNYNFSLNTYDIWKRTFTQILNKGVIVESWRRKIYWVVQENIYHYFEARYNLQDIGCEADCSTVFVTYDLLSQPEHLELRPNRQRTATVDQLFSAFRNNPNIPSLDDFMSELGQKVRAKAQLSLYRGAANRPDLEGLDIYPPTASGKVSEADESYE